MTEGTWLLPLAVAPATRELFALLGRRPGEPEWCVFDRGMFWEQTAAVLPGLAPELARVRLAGGGHLVVSDEYRLDDRLVASTPRVDFVLVDFAAAAPEHHRAAAGQLRDPGAVSGQFLDHPLLGSDDVLDEIRWFPWCRLLLAAGHPARTLLNDGETLYRLAPDAAQAVRSAVRAVDGLLA